MKNTESFKRIKIIKWIKKQINKKVILITLIVIQSLSMNLTETQFIFLYRDVKEDLKKYNFKDIIIVETKGLSTGYVNDGGVILAFQKGELDEEKSSARYEWRS